MNRAATWERIHQVIRESKDDLVRQGQPSGGQALIGHLASRVVELQDQLAKCQRERDALHFKKQIKSILEVQHEMTSKIREAIAATKENNDG